MSYLGLINHNLMKKMLSFVSPVVPSTGLCTGWRKSRLTVVCMENDTIINK